MLNYTLLLISIFLILMGIRTGIRGIHFTKKRGILVAIITILFTLYSLFFLFSDYITGNGMDRAIIYFLRDTFTGYAWSYYLPLFLFLTVIVLILFSLIYTIIKRHIHRNESTAVKYIRHTAIFYLFASLSFAASPATLGIVRNLAFSHDMEVKANIRDAENRYDTNRFIAHAGGMIDGHVYTNSLEALDQNYKNGFRLFELDILTTSDNIFVAAHDWNRWMEFTGYRGELPPALAEFKQYKILQKYTPLDINDINEWFTRHPDAVLVTDKVNAPTAFSNQFIDKNRLMMELFTLDTLQEGLALRIRSAMPTWGLLSDIKGDKVKSLVDMGVTDIAASRRVIKFNIPFLKKLREKDIHVYVFHVKDDGKDENYVIKYDMDYIYGLYADTLDITSLSQIHPNPNPH